MGRAGARQARLAGVKLSTIRSPHTKPDVSLSIKIVSDGKTFVFSGDTGWNDELLDFSAGANLLLCECTYFDPIICASTWNCPELKRNLDRFDVKRIILTHLGRETISHTPEIEIEMGFDGMKLEL